MEQRTVVRSPQALGRVLAHLRYEAGLTQEELAEVLGLSRRYVYELESGRPNLYATRLFEMLRELGAHVEVVSPRHGGTAAAEPDADGRGSGA